MNALSVSIIIFIVIESMNIAMLYFVPTAKKGNGVGIFKAYEKSKTDPEIHTFIQYLVNWVAGTKLIFITLLIVILITGNRMTMFLSVAVMIPSVATFYWRLYPIIKKMDIQGEISPKGYSKILFGMITAFLTGFAAALIISLINNNI